MNLARHLSRKAWATGLNSGGRLLNRAPLFLDLPRSFMSVISKVGIIGGRWMSRWRWDEPVQERVPYQGGHSVD